MLKNRCASNSEGKNPKSSAPRAWRHLTPRKHRRIVAYLEELGIQTASEGFDSRTHALLSCYMRAVCKKLCDNDGSIVNKQKKIQRGGAFRLRNAR